MDKIKKIFLASVLLLLFGLFLALIVYYIINDQWLLVILFFVFLVLPFIVMLGKNYFSKEGTFVGWVLVIVLSMVYGVFLYWAVLNNLFVFIVGLIAYALAVFLTVIIKRKINTKRIAEYEKIYGFGHIVDSLNNALEIMDTTHKWYQDENQATLELVSVLKACGLEDVENQFRLPNGRTADIRIGEALVECKISPNTAETDRLLGQLGNYTEYSSEVYLVIFGKLEYEASKRIEKEIIDRYVGKIFLVDLVSAKRLKKDTYPYDI